MTRRSRRAGRGLRQGGFTLLELLVSLTLLGFVSVILVEAFRETSSLWRAVDQDLDHDEAVLLTQRFLRARLEALALYTVSADARRRVYPVEGEARELSFSSNAPESSAAGGIFRYRLYENQGDLMLAWRIDRNGTADPLAGEDWQAERLAENIRSLRIRYLTRESETDRPRWVDRWYREAQPPELVTIDVVEADGTHWPDLALATHVDTPADCVFDAVSRACRAE